MERAVHHRVCPRMDGSSHIPQPAQGEHQKYELRQCNRGQVCSAYLV